MEEGKKNSIEEKKRIVVDRSHDIQIKFTYYILAVDGACIAFALNYNKDAHYSLYTVPFIAAIFFWLVSFHFGVQELRLTDAILNANYKLLEAQRTENDKEKIACLKELIEKNKKLTRISRNTIRFLYTATITFLMWYFLKMYVNSLPLIHMGLSPR